MLKQNNNNYTTIADHSTACPSVCMYLSEEPPHTPAHQATDHLPSEIVKAQPAENVRPSSVEALLRITVGVCESDHVGEVEHERECHDGEVAVVSEYAG